MEQLKHEIQQELATQSGTFAVAFYDLNNNRELLINADTVFHAASTMKTPVMVEVFRQAREGRFKLSDQILINNEFKSIVDGSNFQLSETDDSDTAIYKHIGEKRSIDSLMTDMIIKSSNLATNLIIQLVGPENVMKNLKALGIHGLTVLRGVEDQKAYDKGLNNTTTAQALMRLFSDIALNKAGRKKDDAQMIQILERQQHNRMIPALLPPAVRVAHKTGNITGVEHDSGIVFLPDGKKYVLVLLSKNLTDTNAAVQSLARVSKMIYDFVVQHHSNGGTEHL